MIISYSMNYGVQKCVWTALGDVTANIIQATLVIFVIGSFFSENSTLLNAFKWIGVATPIHLNALSKVEFSEKKDPITKITKVAWIIFAVTSPSAVQTHFCTP